jgi:lipopolysaccharide export system protein LptC
MTSHSSFSSSSNRRRWFVFVFLILLAVNRVSHAEEQQNDDAAVAQENDDASYTQGGDDYIKYWTDYAILPKRCIV